MPNKKSTKTPSRSCCVGSCSWAWGCPAMWVMCPGTVHWRKLTSFLPVGVTCILLLLYGLRPVSTTPSQYCNLLAWLELIAGPVHAATNSVRSPGHQSALLCLEDSVPLESSITSSSSTPVFLSVISTVSSFIYYFFISCVLMVHTGRSEGNLQVFSLSSHHVGSSDRTGAVSCHACLQVPLPAELSVLAVPLANFGSLWQVFTCSSSPDHTPSLPDFNFLLLSSLPFCFSFPFFLRHDLIL